MKIFIVKRIKRGAKNPEKKLVLFVLSEATARGGNMNPRKKLGSASSGLPFIFPVYFVSLLRYSQTVRPPTLGARRAAAPTAGFVDRVISHTYGTGISR